MEKYCINCKFFEKRTGFCRKDPPKPIIIEENGKIHISTVFTKIPLPNMDYCFQFVSKQI